ncbi:MAG: tRNA (adenosine(37)-N6)-threonylcarbamoyltransferase complex dimerization subunit type 1 TsaB [Deltaproteobacteria bacterium]|nr:MAG: tRNA (adenosine(37)-N6)-threonylcarbamoyltransferase complex dimerization subunit type 1 TsaB [Deltaproteobacteria bacterium]TMQ19138.1 MAG: tRNA (adenosine(37)-N6)-threonylcarbamoyltransferase complex dimerization subunit type 1 TsaB [Deltaproteobacteria bacterium]
MRLLGIDTATAAAGIAIVDGDGRVLAEARHATQSRGADLLVAIDRLCREAGVDPADLDAIAIGAGPGSFTGLRIGMATAKGIAFAANRPLWAVSSLAALADDAAHELAGDPRRGGVICAALDARRGEVFAGCFQGGVALATERVLAPEELAPWIAELARGGDVPVPMSFAGDAIEAHAALAALAHVWLAARTPSGAAVARLALAGARVDITRGGAPTYIRPSEAEVKYPDGVPGALRRRDP